MGTVDDITILEITACERTQWAIEIEDLDLGGSSTAGDAGADANASERMPDAGE